ncbi:Transcription termination protein NusB [hydrothermal vent metagenome]|uniref:Transcription termination protein NusB n=1 Tax=hydrothermal vent metagenome TaxID=652676 RepID=A0A3B0ZSD3_9ZZZZ
MSRTRSQARRCAVQALYQWQLTGTDVAEVAAQILEDKDVKKVDSSYFRGLLSGVVKQVDKMDALLTPTLDRSIESLDPVELAIMRMGAYELQYNIEVPYRVVINEAVELAKTFGADQGHKYVNGVLDKLAVTLRGAEVKQKRPSR